jgi:hypothetical protein
MTEVTAFVVNVVAALLLKVDSSLGQFDAESSFVEFFIKSRPEFLMNQNRRRDHLASQVLMRILHKISVTSCLSSVPLWFSGLNHWMNHAALGLDSTIVHCGASQFSGDCLPISTRSTCTRFGSPWSFGRSAKPSTFRSVFALMFATR